MENTLLKGKVILITGGSLGIGYAVAEKCVEAGAQVVIASRTEKDLKDAAEKLKSKDSVEPCIASWMSATGWTQKNAVNGLEKNLDLWTDWSIARAFTGRSAL